MTELTRRGVLTGVGSAVGLAAIASCGSNAQADPGHPAGASGSGLTSATVPPVAATTSAGASSTSAPATAGASLELDAGALSDVPVGGAKLVSVDGHDLVITQPTAGQPAVFVNRCPHAGCKVGVDGAALVCPCHASKFDLAGKVLRGPATTPLKEGTLRVDKGQIIVEQA